MSVNPEMLRKVSCNYSHISHHAPSQPGIRIGSRQAAAIEKNWRYTRGLGRNRNVTVDIIQFDFAGKAGPVAISPAT